MGNCIALVSSPCATLSRLWNIFGLCGLSEELDTLCLKYTKFDVKTAGLNQHEAAVQFSMYVASHCGAQCFLPPTWMIWKCTVPFFCLPQWRLAPTGNIILRPSHCRNTNRSVPRGKCRHFVFSVGQLYRHDEAFHNSVPTRVVKPASASRRNIWCCTRTIERAFIKTEHEMRLWF
jgi:hypothetical protein